MRSSVSSNSINKMQPYLEIKTPKILISITSLLKRKPLVRVLQSFKGNFPLIRLVTQPMKGKRT